LINASNFSRDSSLLYNKAQITPLLELITEQSDTQIVRQTIRALFIIPFKWIAENEIKFDPSKPAMFFQMDAEEQAEVFKELMKNSEVRHILFEELFFPENRLILEMFHENELVTNELFMEKNRSGYSSVFFQPKGDEGEDHHGINHILFVDPEAIKVC